MENLDRFPEQVAIEVKPIHWDTATDVYNCVMVRAISDIWPDLKVGCGRDGFRLYNNEEEAFSLARYDMSELGRTITLSYDKLEKPEYITGIVVATRVDTGEWVGIGE